ncbi:MAG: hypothetical protein KDA89_15020 [Planctomycetaceae bacterium]|nr:hypothetical protein [Planctomycetaceae bacterium]
MKKSKHLEILSVHVAGGKTIRAAADLIGISEATAYSISSSDEFRQSVSRLRSEAINAAVGALSDAASKAVATLLELLSPEHEPAVRLNASKAILTHLGPLSEHGELRQRIQDIETKAQLKVAR